MYLRLGNREKRIRIFLLVLCFSPFISPFLQTALAQAPLTTDNTPVSTYQWPHSYGEHYYEGTFLAGEQESRFYTYSNQVTLPPGLKITLIGHFFSGRRTKPLTVTETPEGPPTKTPATAPTPPPQYDEATIRRYLEVIDRELAAEEALHPRQVSVAAIVRKALPPEKTTTISVSALLARSKVGADGGTTAFSATGVSGGGAVRVEHRAQAKGAGTTASSHTRLFAVEVQARTFAAQVNQSDSLTEGETSQKVRFFAFNADIVAGQTFGPTPPADSKNLFIPELGLRLRRSPLVGQEENPDSRDVFFSDRVFTGLLAGLLYERRVDSKTTVQVRPTAGFLAGSDQIRGMDVRLPVTLTQRQEEDASWVFGAQFSLETSTGHANCPAGVADCSERAKTSINHLEIGAGLLIKL